MNIASQEIVPDVSKILVLRPNRVGDFVFALPALHALRRAYPDAKIIFIGKQWHADFLEGRPGPVDEVVVMPPYPGIGAPVDTDSDPVRIQEFMASMRSAEADLAVQIYGGGRYSNPFIKRLGARLTIGLKAADAEPLDRWVSFPFLHNERLLMLETVALVGANTVSMGQELRVTNRDRDEVAQLIPSDASRPLVVIHPAASDVRRHWPADRFAAVADFFADRGATIAINGVAVEAGLVRAVMDKMRHPAVSTCGKLSVSGLCGLLDRAALLISNDSGPLHLALAIGTPSVGIYWLTNLYLSGPLNQDRHRAAMATRVHCPVCGAPNITSRCPHDVCFVDEISFEEVVGLAVELFENDGSVRMTGRQE
jgi:ADP-heptose:LPS heptosyltransferase